MSRRKLLSIALKPKFLLPKANLRDFTVLNRSETFSINLLETKHHEEVEMFSGTFSKWLIKIFQHFELFSEPDVDENFRIN